MNTHILLTTSAALAALLLPTTASAQQRVDNRQDRQEQRIDAGIESGRLTASETARLERQQARINRYEARSRADGPGLTKRERVRLENRQDRASRNIFRQKRDRQRRPN